jgi:DNA transformation protein and related proteins
MTSSLDTASYYCDLLSTAGPCVAKRMFGGFGISTGGLTLAILADLGDGEKLWLKGDDASRSQYAAAGCAIFTYPMKGVPRSMNYFCAPEDAMDSADAMRPWAALALACAVRAHAGKRKPKSATVTIAQKNAAQPDAAPTTPAKSTQLSPAVLQRARDVAKKLALSGSMPPLATKAPANAIAKPPVKAPVKTVAKTAAKAAAKLPAKTVSKPASKTATKPRAPKR